MNPAPSGISDYSEELLPYLAQYADITLYLDEQLQPTNPALRQHLAVAPLRRLARDQRRTPYDAIVYHIGNSPAHARIWTIAHQLPGVVVLHDFVLHHFMLWYAASIEHDVQRYVAYMARRYGEAGQHMAHLMIRSRFTDAAFDFPCCEPVLDAAQAVLVHSRYVQQQITALRPTLPTGVVPMGVPLPLPLDGAWARNYLGLPPTALVLASFGHINAYKRLESTLQAVQELRRTYPNLCYVLVGSVSPNYNLASLIERMGLQDVVRVTGYVPRATFEAYVAAADICINLRHPTGGETSASLLRLLGAGRPTLVSATGAFAEVPTGVAAQVDVDGSELELILAYCRLLAARPELARALGQEARSYIAREHNLERAAQGYIRCLARIYGWPLVRRWQDRPLWTEQPAAALAPLVTNEAAPAASTAETSTPPTNPVVAQVGRALAEVGLTEQNDSILQAVAGQVAALGLPDWPTLSAETDSLE